MIINDDIYLNRIMKKIEEGKIIPGNKCNFYIPYFENRKKESFKEEELTKEAYTYFYESKQMSLEELPKEIIDRDFLLTSYPIAYLKENASLFDKAFYKDLIEFIPLNEENKSYTLQYKN